MVKVTVLRPASGTQACIRLDLWLWPIRTSKGRLEAEIVSSMWRLDAGGCHPHAYLPCSGHFLVQASVSLMTETHDDASFSEEVYFADPVHPMLRSAAGLWPVAFEWLVSSLCCVAWQNHQHQTERRCETHLFESYLAAASRLTQAVQSAGKLFVATISTSYRFLFPSGTGETSRYEMVWDGQRKFS